MTIAEFSKLLDDGLRPVIEFKESESHVDSYADPGMRARATGWTDEDEGVVRISVHFSEFEQFNLQLEKPDYYDKNGRPTLTAHQAGCYRATDTYYYDRRDQMDTHFVIVEDYSLKLYKQYHEANPGQSYVAWLEDKVAEPTQDKAVIVSDMDKPAKCYCCGFATEELKEYARPGYLVDGDSVRLCRLCESTPAGVGYGWPDSYPNADVLKTICYVGNVILKAIEEIK